MSKRVVEVVLKMKDQASGGVQKFADKLGISVKAVAAIGAAALAMGVAVVAGFKKAISIASKLTQEMADLGDSFDKASTRTSVNVEKLAEWTFLMERAGGSQSSLESAIRRLTKSMVDQQRGLLTAVDAWDAVGVSTTDAEGNLRDVDSVLMDLATSLSRMGNQTEALGISQDILGRGAAQMVALLAQGGPELDRQRILFKLLNAEMSEGFTKGAAEVIDAQTDLQWAIRGLKADLMEPLQPILAETIDEIALALGSFGDWIEDNQSNVKSFGEDLGTVAVAFVNITAALTEFTIKAADFKDFILLPGPELRNIALLINLLGSSVEETGAKIENTNMFENLFPPEMFGPGGTISRQAAELEKLDRFIASIAAAPTVQRDLGAAEFEGLQDTFGLIEDIMAVEAERAAQSQTSHAAEATALMAEHEMLQQAAEDSDEHIARLQEMQTAEEVLADTVNSVADNFERLVSNSLSAMLKGTNGAIMFGRALKGVVLDALSAVLAKMLKIQALKLFTGFFTGGGPLPFASGGQVPARAANGYSVPDGPRGRDSVLLAGMPGEEVINRSLSQRMADFLASRESAAMASPFDLASAAGRSIAVALNIGRPVGYLDYLDMGEAVIVAAQEVARADL